jgi:multidrug resistance efflux pump
VVYLFLSAIIFTMNYNHPYAKYAKYAKEVFVSVPIVPQVTGTVNTVNVVPNQLVNKGEVLFTLENEQQKIALAKADAALIEAKSGIAKK